MIKGTIKFLDNSADIGVIAGVGEDLKSTREIAQLEKQGYVFDDTLTMTYKMWLAGKRQGDISVDTNFTDWVENVAEVMVKPSSKDLDFAVASGNMTREQADAIINLMESDEQGEAVAPPAE